MSTLTVALPFHAFDPSTELVFVLSPDGRTMTAQGAAPLALLPKADVTVLVVPARRLTFHSIMVPQAPKAKLKAALEGLLEDRLLESTDAQAYALAPDAKARQTSWVASYDRRWLVDVCTSFDEAGHRLASVVPQAWPSDTTTLAATGSPDDPWLVKAGADGVLAVPLKSGGFLIAGLEDNTPIITPPELSTQVESALQRPVQLRSQGQNLLASRASPWELAQFDLKLGNAKPWLKTLNRAWTQLLHQPRWRAVRWGLVGLVVVNLVGLNVLAWREKSALQDKQALQARLFAQTFPKVSLIVNPALQMRRELDALSARSATLSRSDMETQLGALSASLGDGEGLNPASLSFANGQLNLKGLALPPERSASMKQILDGQGFSLEQANDTLTLSKKNTP
jgi:general secretion pathway protein L